MVRVTASAAPVSLVSRYDRHAAGYRRWWAPVLAPTARRVLDRLERRMPGLPGEPLDVLDLGTGTGTLARAAVERWPAARVTGLDVSAGMLAVARDEAAVLPAAARRRLTFVRGEADALPFPAASFDAAVSSFVVQLVPERGPVLAELARVLRPGATLTLVGWMRDETAFAPEDALADAFEEVGVEPPDEQEPRAGDFRSLRTAADELRRAGFRRVHAELDEVAWDWTPDDYAAYRGYREEDVLVPLPAERRAAFEAAFRRRLAVLPPAAFRFRAPVAALVADRA